jgi:CheY-like chemotaxis protein
LEETFGFHNDVIRGGARFDPQHGAESQPSDPLSFFQPAEPPPDEGAFSATYSQQQQFLVPLERPVLLVVEDEADDFILLRRALKRAGVLALVCWAQTASEALNTLGKLQSRARVCVVTDVKLPGTDGFELLKLVRARVKPPQLKFSFLTGRPDPTTERRAYSSGADAFFVKPARSEDWMEVARALEKLVMSP